MEDSMSLNFCSSSCTSCLSTKFFSILPQIGGAFPNEIETLQHTLMPYPMYTAKTILCYKNKSNIQRVFFSYEKYSHTLA